VTPARANYNFKPFYRHSVKWEPDGSTFYGYSTGDNTNPLDTTNTSCGSNTSTSRREPMKTGLTTGAIRYSLRSAADCVRAQRTGVAAAFFIEKESAADGSFIYDVYLGALGRRPAFMNTLSSTTGNWWRQLETAKTVFAGNFVQRTEFHDEVSACDDG